MFRLEHDVITGKVVEIALTVAEIAEFEANEKAAQIEETKQAKISTANATSKNALFEKLGITADEATLLLS